MHTCHRHTHSIGLSASLPFHLLPSAVIANREKGGGKKGKGLKKGKPRKMYHSQQQAPVGGHAQGAIPQGAYAQQGNFGMQGHHYQSYATGGYAPAMPMAYGGQQSYPGMYAGAAYQQQQYRRGHDHGQSCTRRLRGAVASVAA